MIAQEMQEHTNKNAMLLRELPQISNRGRLVLGQQKEENIE